MRTEKAYPDRSDFFESFGNSEILSERKRDMRSASQDWLMFKTAEDALEFFSAAFGVLGGYGESAC